MSLACCAACGRTLAADSWTTRVCAEDCLDAFASALRASFPVHGAPVRASA